MPVTVLVGCQWGDEGKGKIADHLARGMDWVARYAGGHNAGHTVAWGRQTLVLHLIPCGILQKRPRCVIGHGTVVDPTFLVKEMDQLLKRRVTLEGRLFVAETAHVVMPYHRWLEILEGQDTRIGTTKQGIGPAYQDKAGRSGIRMLEILDAPRFRARLEEHMETLAERFRLAGKEPPQPLDASLEEWTARFGELARRLRPFVADTIDLLNTAARRDERILCEGAQGTFLDLDLGTYPFVTSSTTTAGGAATGLGLPPSMLKRVAGVCKAYATRVGEGPFPTELTGSEGQALRDRGAEFGATTGRPRRVGWLDLVQLRQAVRVNGVTSLYLTKMDILSGMGSIRLCTRYVRGDRSFTLPPNDSALLAESRPEYEEMEGWTEPLDSVRRYADLPPQAQAYVSRIEAEIGCRVQAVSVGSGRNAMVLVPAKR